MATVRIKGDSGNHFDLDLSKVSLSTPSGKLTAEQEQAVHKLFSTGDVSSLDNATRDKLKDVSARIGVGAVPELASAVLANFDLKFVTIS
jgi:Ca2+-binding EF-hand superfamily protein